LPYRLLPSVGAALRQPACLALLRRPTPVLAPERRSLPHARAARNPRCWHSRTLHTASAPLPRFAPRPVTRLVFPHVAAPLRSAALPPVPASPPVAAYFSCVAPRITRLCARVWCATHLTAPAPPASLAILLLQSNHQGAVKTDACAIIPRHSSSVSLALTSNGSTTKAIIRFPCSYQ
jgi:hypothetical protein